MKSQYWVNDLTHYKPADSSLYWGEQQAVFGISLSGQVLLTDNRSSDQSPLFFSKKNMGNQYYLGIYSWKEKHPELYVFDALEKHIFNKSVQEGLRSLVGVHQIKVGTPVISNTSRKILFHL